MLFPTLHIASSNAKNCSKNICQSFQRIFPVFLGLFFLSFPCVIFVQNYLIDFSMYCVVFLEYSSEISWEVSVDFFNRLSINLCHFFLSRITTFFHISWFPVPWNFFSSDVHLYISHITSRHYSINLISALIFVCYF